jgi:eukaryotic-like serine/threonine-protein kinase
MSCLTDEVFAAWVSGRLDARELEQVEDHAADCAVCRGVAIAMRGLVPHVAPTLGAIGATIGRYRVVAPLGEGAMGVVVRGRDPVLERDVAIKMVNAIAMTAEQRDLMLHEAKMLALVDHPNVVRVHDAGILGDEVFVAMELLAGTTLAKWLAEQPR